MSDSDNLRYLHEHRIVRTTPANPGWWAVYEEGETLWYEPVALWAEINVGVYTVNKTTRRSSSTQWESGRNGDYEDRDDRTVLVVALRQDPGSVYLEGILEDSDGYSSSFVRYVYEPARTAGGAVPRERDAA